MLVQRHTFAADPALYARAREYLERARMLEDSESECHRILASANLYRRRFEEAEEHQRIALELNPNDDRILSQMGELLTYLGRPEEALPWIELSMRLNPYLADTTCFDHGRALYQLGQLEAAHAAFRRIRAPRAAHHTYQAAIAARLGRPEEAAQHLARAHESFPTFSVREFVRSLPYRNPEVSERILEDLGCGPRG